MDRVRPPVSLTVKTLARVCMADPARRASRSVVLGAIIQAMSICYTSSLVDPILFSVRDYIPILKIFQNYRKIELTVNRKLAILDSTGGTECR